MSRPQTTLDLWWSPGERVHVCLALWVMCSFHSHRPALVVSALKNDSPGSTSPAATSTDATTGARGLRGARTQGRATAPQPVENVPCAGAWVPTCLCGWAVNPLCTWTPALRLTLSCRVATCAPRGQPGTGLKPHYPMGRTPSDPSAPSAPRPSAPPAGHGSSSRAPSTSRGGVSKVILSCTRELNYVQRRIPGCGCRLRIPSLVSP